MCIAVNNPNHHFSTWLSSKRIRKHIENNRLKYIRLIKLIGQVFIALERILLDLFLPFFHFFIGPDSCF